MAASAPSLIRELAERERAGRENGTWPENLRIETFANSKADWAGYTKDVRTSLKKFAKEH
jgi:hypothetical protein